MPIDFILRPVNGGIPLFNAGRHSVEEIIAALVRVAEILKGTRVFVHPVQTEILSFQPAPTIFSIAPTTNLDIPADGGYMTSENGVVAEIFGLPISADKLRRAEEMKKNGS